MVRGPLTRSASRKQHKARATDGGTGTEEEDDDEDEDEAALDDNDETAEEVEDVAAI